MVEKLASSEIAQSRAGFEKLMRDTADRRYPAYKFAEGFVHPDGQSGLLWEFWQAAERDTRERCAQLLEQRATVFTEVAHPEEKHKYAALVLQSEGREHSREGGKSMSETHCWEDGPLLCKECRAECEYLCPAHPEAGAVGTSCMALQGHEGEHEFCADDLITISFK